MAKKTSKSRKLIEDAMREVHTDEPSTVKRAKVSPERKERMRKRIALEKARTQGAKLPRR